MNLIETKKFQFYDECDLEFYQSDQQLENDSKIEFREQFQYEADCQLNSTNWWSENSEQCQPRSQFESEYGDDDCCDDDQEFENENQSFMNDCYGNSDVGQINIFYDDSGTNFGYEDAEIFEDQAPENNCYQDVDENETYDGDPSLRSRI
jgi:hypothetical protein